MNLSEHEYPGEFFPKEKVKEFIRELKEMINREDLIDWDDFVEELDKLAGDKLI